MPFDLKTARPVAPDAATMRPQRHAWEDAPVVEDSSAGRPDWESAPVVEPTKGRFIPDPATAPGRFVPDSPADRPGHFVPDNSGGFDLSTARPVYPAGHAYEAAPIVGESGSTNSLVDADGVKKGAVAKGVADNVLPFASSLYAQPLAVANEYVNHAGKMLGINWLQEKLTGKPVESPEQARERVTNALQVKPFSQEGRDVQSAAAVPVQAVVSRAQRGIQAADKALGTGDDQGGVLQDISRTFGKVAVDATTMLPIGRSVLKPAESAAVMKAPASPKPAGPVSVFKESMTPAQRGKAAADLLLSKDVPLKASQRADGFLADELDSLGRGANTWLGPSEATGDQVRAFTRALAADAGIGQKLLTPDTMSKAMDDAVARYDALHAKAPTKLDADLRAKLSDIAESVEGEVIDPNKRSFMRNKIDQILNTASDIAKESEALGPLAGEADRVLAGRKFTRFQSEIGRLSRTDRELSPFLRDMSRALDDAFERSNPGEVAASMQDARIKYKRLKQLEAMVTGRPDGVVTPKRANAVLSQARNRNDYIYGRGDQGFLDLVRAGLAKLPEKYADSGTAPRAAAAAALYEVASGGVKGVARVAATKGLGLLGRKVEDGRMYRGTPTGEAARSAKSAGLAAAMSRGNDLAANPVPLAVSIKENEEQRRKRLLSDAMTK